MKESLSLFTDENFREEMRRTGLEIPKEYFSGALDCTREIRTAVALLNAHRRPCEEPANGFNLSANLSKYRKDHE